MADPIHADLKRVCSSLRRAAGPDRVLFHYNGHGVPMLTGGGELWCFNNTYSQYVPLNLLDLHTSLGSPNLFVLDCHGAGAAFDHFITLLDQFDLKYAEKNRPHPPPHHASVMLAATSRGEYLPSCPPLPADIFTSCLTTPIKTALLWFAKRAIGSIVTMDMLDRIPGTLKERDTPLGELNWIFTAVTDTIAYTLLPTPLFKRLYRQDVLLSSLMRNYLLADRIFRSFGRHPQVHPALPKTHDHPLWQSFDIAMEQLLFQLPTLLASEQAKHSHIVMNPPPPPLDWQTRNAQQKRPVYISVENALNTSPQMSMQGPYASLPRKAMLEYSYTPSSFFVDHITAFDVWLHMGLENRSPPLQLPIILQVLLSPDLRPKALPLISRYMQLGPQAVHHALTVGIFPYLLRLLKSKSRKLLQDIVFMWGKLVALDESCRMDLTKEEGDVHFIKFVMPCNNHPDPSPVYIAVALFVVSVIAKDYADRCISIGALDACFQRLNHEHAFVRRWACLCLTQIIRASSSTSNTPFKTLQWSQLVHLLHLRATHDNAPDVRAAAVAALSTIMNGVLEDIASPSNAIPQQQQPPSYGTDIASVKPQSPPESSEPAPTQHVDYGGDSPSNTPLISSERDVIVRIGKPLSGIARNESSVLVRREVAIAIANAAKHRPHRFIHAAYSADVVGLNDDEDDAFVSDLDECEMIYRRLWVSLSELAFDPHPIVAALARRSYDVTYDLISKRARQRSLFKSIPSNSQDPFASAGSSFNSNSGEALSATSSSPEQPGAFGNRLLSSTRSLSGDAVQMWPGNRVNLTSPTSLPTASGGGEIPPGHAIRPRGVIPTPGQPPIGLHRSHASSSVLAAHKFRRSGMGEEGSPSVLQKSRRGKIHVRSTSGSFDLNVPNRPYMSGIPRVNSLSMMQSPKRHQGPVGRPGSAGQSFANKNTLHYEGYDGDRRRSSGSGHDITGRSSNHFALGKGVGNLMRSLSHQLNLNVRTYPARASSTASNDSSQSITKDDRGFNPKSPPRPPMRSYSYQVLSAAAALSQENTRPRFGVAPLSSRQQKKKFNANHYSKYLSGDGDAALSLYEWSCACMSRVQFDGTSSDFTREEEPMARYAALWQKFTMVDNETPLEDTLRAYATLPDRQSSLKGGYGREDRQDWSEFATAKKLASHNMSAGGGTITAMAFLPRDTGIADDQLIATGDSNGSVGVYDIKSGKCHGSFGVPSPPGLREIGINAIFCLNRPSVEHSDDTLPNSRSALILAGAYDGRVAVFKSDVEGRNYRIMSTFQASGQSLCSKAGTARDRYRGMTGENVMGLVTDDAEGSVEEVETIIRQCGNGLAMDFNADNSCLAAAGCEGEIVRLWDLSREHCIWKGRGGKDGVIPTAVSISRTNDKVVYVGCSDGTVNMLDMDDNSLRRITTLKHPIISVGSCTLGNEAGVICGDMSGALTIVTESSHCEQVLPTWMCAMTMHSSGRFVACASNTTGHTGKIKILCPRHNAFGKVREYDVTGKVACVAFQQETGLLGVGCGGGGVVAFGKPEHVSVWDG